MAGEILKADLKIGQEIKLKVYVDWNDWEEHTNEIAKIIEIFDPVQEEGFDVSILWADDATSRVPLNNLILINRDWDE